MEFGLLVSEPLFPKYCAALDQRYIFKLSLVLYFTNKVVNLRNGTYFAKNSYLIFIT